MIYLHILLLILFVVFSCVFIAHDQEGKNPSYKWVLGLIIITYLTVLTDNVNNLRTLSFYSSEQFLRNIGLYLLTGALYSVFELMMHIISEKKRIASAWQKWVTKNAPLRSFFDGTQDEDTTNKARELVASFAFRNGGTLVGLNPPLPGEYPEPVPTLQTRELSSHLFTWAILWPMYATWLVYDKMLRGAFEMLAEAIQGVTRKYLSYVFDNTFNIKKD